LNRVGISAAALLVALAQPSQATEPTSAAAFVSLVEQADSKSAAKDWTVAARLWERVVAANPVEGRFWSRLAEARYAAKDYRGAIPAFEKAVELGYGLPQNNAYNIACAYALAGDRDHALAWLKRALDMAYLDLDSLRTDPDLASVRSDPRFAALVPLSDTAGMSRAQGWRQDLDFLLWQMDRVGAAPYRVHPRSWFAAEFDRLARSSGSLNDIQMALKLGSILREIGDGHSGMMGGMTKEWALSLPLQFQDFEEGIFLTAADPRYRDLLGAQVLAIGGKPIAQLSAVLADTVSRDNQGPWVRLQSASRLRYTGLLAAAGFIPDGAATTLRLRMPDGSEHTVTVPSDTSLPDIWNMKPKPAQWTSLAETLPGPLPISLRDPAKNYWADALPDGRTVYMGFNTVRDMNGESLAAFSARLRTMLAQQPVERLIVDLRWNNGGNTRLLPPLIAAIAGSERINRKGHLFVIIGRRTFSAAQNAATLLQRFTNATFVGEPTGSSPNFVGEDDPFVLPYSKLKVNVSTLAWQSSIPQDKRSWIAPLIYVPPTFAAYRAKRDEALEAILSLQTP
jgi:tetratricopeptide (TPR) repeat protein